jgi:hypothetical protein
MPAVTPATSQPASTADRAARTHELAQLRRDGRSSLEIDTPFKTTTGPEHPANGFRLSRSLPVPPVDFWFGV